MPSPKRVLFNKDDQHSLIINECDLTDVGEYKLLAQNMVGEASTQCRINVQPKPPPTPVQNPYEQTSEPNLSPIFSEPLSDIYATEKQDICFKCKVQSVLPVTVKWYKDETLLSETTNIKVRVNNFITTS